MVPHLFITIRSQKLPVTGPMNITGNGIHILAFRLCNTFYNQIHAFFNSKMAAGQHQIIAFRLAPDSISIEIKMAFSHAVDLMDPLSGFGLTDLVSGHDTLHTGLLITVNENRKHVFPAG